MAQALPSITIPSAVYTTPVQRELKNTQLEGEGVKLSFLYEAWPDVPLLFTVEGEISLVTGQPAYQPWFKTTFSGAAPTRGNTSKMKVAYWPGENDGSGGRNKLKGDFRLTLTPAQSFRTTITIEII